MKELDQNLLNLISKVNTVSEGHIHRISDHPSVDFLKDHFRGSLHDRLGGGEGFDDMDDSLGQALEVFKQHHEENPSISWKDVVKQALDEHRTEVANHTADIASELHNFPNHAD